MKFATHAIHTGQKPEKEFGAVIPPIYMTSTFAQESPGNYKEYDYTRAGNPNFSNLEATMAALENAAGSVVFSSGMGGLTAIVSMFAAGDKVLANNDLYGGTYRLFTQSFAQFGIGFSVLDMSDLEELERQVAAQQPKMILVETPSNPLLNISDIAGIVAIAKKYGALTLVDNTFATPFFQNPLDLGADMVMHSATKYLGGHSDVIGGVVCANSSEILEKIAFARKSMGLNPSPFDTWLISRGLKTLAVRMEKHEKNATAVAHLLTEHPRVKKIYYPGLATHPNHAVAAQQMRGFGGLVSVEFDLSLQEAMQAVSSFSVFTLAESLGGIESLVNHPASMTHASIPQSERLKNGLGDGLIRFSVGIEDQGDLLADLLAHL